MSDEDEGGTVVSGPWSGDSSYAPPPIPSFVDTLPPEEEATDGIVEDAAVEVPQIPDAPSPPTVFHSPGIPDEETEEGGWEGEGGEHFQRRSLADRLGDWLEFRIERARERHESEAPFREAEIARKAAHTEARTAREVAAMEQNGKLQQVLGKAKSDKAAARGKADADRMKSSGAGWGAQGSGRGKSGRSGRGGGSGQGGHNSGPSWKSSATDPTRKGSGKGSGQGSGGRSGSSWRGGASGGGKGSQTGRGGSGQGGAKGAGGGKGSGTSKGSGGGKDAGKAKGSGGGKDTSRPETRSGRKDEGPKGTKPNWKGTKPKTKESPAGSKGTSAGSKPGGSGAKSAPGEPKPGAAGAKRDRTLPTARVLDPHKPGGRTWKKPPAPGSSKGASDPKGKNGTSGSKTGKDTNRGGNPFAKPGEAAGGGKNTDAPHAGASPGGGKDRTTRASGPRTAEPGAGDGWTSAFRGWARDSWGNVKRPDPQPWPVTAESLGITVEREAPHTAEEGQASATRPAGKANSAGSTQGAHAAPGAGAPWMSTEAKGLPRAPEPHTKRPGTSRPAGRENSVSNLQTTTAGGGRGLAAKHRTNVAFSEYLIAMTNIAIKAAVDKDRAESLALALGRIADALEAMAADLGDDHNIAPQVVTLITDLAEAATRMKATANRVADHCAAASDAAALAAQNVAQVYGEDMSAKEHGGLSEVSAAAHH